MPRIAIAMPVYNDEQYVALALEALSKQTLRDFHLTVVDDGSVDRSAEIVESFADRMPINLILAPHRGLRTTKRAAVDSAPTDTDYLMIHDSDIALPPDALERMINTLDANEEIAAVMAQARSVPTRRWGRGQAFFEDLVRDTNVNDAGESRWIVGACVMFRRTALRGIRLRVDINEDSALSLQLRDRYKLLQPRDLVASHFGVPTTLKGVWHRGYRDGVRVRALLRAYKNSFQLGTVSRLVPLPLAAAMLIGGIGLQPWVSIGAAGVFAAYTAAFLYASRNVDGDLGTRLEATGLFLLSNVGFGVGFLRESLSKGHEEAELGEPARDLQR
jgi:glycosyltransferase involved in cell wall biosynthesis